MTSGPDEIRGTEAARLREGLSGKPAVLFDFDSPIFRWLAGNGVPVPDSPLSGLLLGGKTLTAAHIMASGFPRLYEDNDTLTPFGELLLSAIEAPVPAPARAQGGDGSLPFADLQHLPPDPEVSWRGGPAGPPRLDDDACEFGNLIFLNACGTALWRPEPDPDPEVPDEVRRRRRTRWVRRCLEWIARHADSSNPWVRAASRGALRAALRARHAAIHGQDAEVDTFARTWLGLSKLEEWREAVSTALLGDWMDTDAGCLC
ncbi:hypothetical protein P8605_44520, partial [Streptomyces sp. T-3]|nr:hypothetical protein [Streptomyces sp. T-3]